MYVFLNSLVSDNFENTIIYFSKHAIFHWNHIDLSILHLIQSNTWFNAMWFSWGWTKWIWSEFQWTLGIYSKFTQLNCVKHVYISVT